MASFKKTQIRSLPKIGQKVTADTLYWRKLNVSKKYLLTVTGSQWAN